MAELLETIPAVELTPDEVEGFSARLRERITARNGLQLSLIHI